MAVEAVDRAMRGETSPSPIYEGEDGVIAWMLGGPDATYDVPLPAEGESKRAILDSYTKEHSAEYQARRGSTSPAASGPSVPSCATPRTWHPSSCTPATTRTT